MDNLEYKKYLLSKELGKASKVETFGLHYNINWNELILRSMMIKALEIDEDIEYYTSDEREQIIARLGVIGLSNSKSSNSKNNNCCNK